LRSILKITFQSKRIEKKGKQLFALNTFTMRGVSKELTLPFQITGVNKELASKKMNLGYSPASCSTEENSE
jgi:polyisoprenoid-binding protein YceI